MRRRRECLHPPSPCRLRAAGGERWRRPGLSYRAPRSSFSHPLSRKEKGILRAQPLSQATRAEGYGGELTIKVRLAEASQGDSLVLGCEAQLPQLGLIPG